MFSKLFRLSRPSTGLRLTALTAASLTVSFLPSACTHTAGTSSPSLVRVIDASYIAPAVNVSVAGTVIASNAGKGTISGYGTANPTNSATIAIAAASGGSSLAQTQASLLAGRQASILLADSGAAKRGYTLTVLEDQNTAAPMGESSFRFLNQAPKTGAVDIYMVPSGSTLAKSTPLVTSLAAGSMTGYVNFSSQTVTLVVTAAGSTKAKYTSKAIALTGGEVRTALILDAALTSNPAIEAVIGDDVN